MDGFHVPTKAFKRTVIDHSIKQMLINYLRIDIVYRRSALQAA
jgi:hypothetical protein